MVQLELTRVVVGLPVAALFPLGIPSVNRDEWVTRSLSLGYSAVVLAPLFPSWKAWFLLGVTLVAAEVARAKLRVNALRKEKKEVNSHNHFLMRSLLVVAVTLGGVAFVAFLVTAWSDAAGYIGAAIFNDKLIIMCNGFLGATFAGDLIVSHAVGPFLDRVEDAKSAQLNNTGAQIGWIERAIFFPLIAGGAAAAAAMALTAKSMVRMPGLRKKPGMTEYVLLGSMLSILVALGFAVLTRVLLGMSPL